MAGDGSRFAWRCCGCHGRFLLAVLVTGATAVHAAPPLVVTNTNDSGAGSLRAAIIAANNNAGTDIINFDIAAPPPNVITLLSPLPTIAEAVTIDGYSEPDAHENTDPVASNAVFAVRLVANDFDGFVIGADGVVIRGLEIAAANGTAVRVSSAGSQVSGCLLRNSNVGVLMGGSDHIVGGTTPADRNIIIDNLAGVLIAGDSHDVVGNLIGVDASGFAEHPNKDVGVNVAGGRKIRIGGTSAPERNVISGNGVGINAFSTDRLTVQGNYIGLDASGQLPLGNVGDGIHLTVLGAGLSTIGGTSADAGNTIVFNGGAGVAYPAGDSGAGAVSIIHNRISSNLGLGIDLGAEGVDTNDDQDPDAGPNGLQNYPNLVAYDDAAGEVQGLLNSQPVRAYRIDLYGSPLPDPSQHGEGWEHIGTVNVSTDGAGDAPFALPVGGVYGVFSATATDIVTGATSEFSGRLLRIVHQVTVTNTNTTGAGSLDDAVATCNASTTPPDVCRISFSILPGGGLESIQLDGPLVPIVPVFIDGTTQSGWSPNTQPPTQPNDATRVIELTPTNPSDSGITSTEGNPLYVEGVRFAGFFNAVDGPGNLFLQGNRFPNNGAGVEVLPVPPPPPPLAPPNVIGGPAPEQSNLFQNNQFAGLMERRTVFLFNRVEGFSTAGVGVLGTQAGLSTVRGNHFESPGGFSIVPVSPAPGEDPLGVRIQGNSTSGEHPQIDLGLDGVTANDAGDGDTGPNLLINYPVLASAEATADGTTLVAGSLDIGARGPVEIEVFDNSSCDGSGNGPGETPVGRFAVQTDETGTGSFTARFPLDLTGREITATTTDVYGNSSEQSACQTVVAAPPTPHIQLSTTDIYFGTVDPGSINTETLTVSNVGDANLDVSGVQWKLGPYSPFSVLNDTCTSTSLPPAVMCTLDVRYEAPLSGVLVLADELQISSNDPAAPVSAVDVFVALAADVLPCPGVYHDQVVTGTLDLIGCDDITLGPNFTATDTAVIGIESDQVVFVAPVDIQTGASVDIAPSP